MRIAVFSYGLPVLDEKRGGIERVAHLLAQGLAERGHQIVVFSHDPKPEGALYEVRDLPWKAFVNTWLGRRVTMGYLGNILAVLPRYGEFDAIIAHGDSLLLPLTRKPIVRVMHGSALEEALHATSPWRFVLQLGIYAQELVTALVQRGTVAVSENARRANPLIRRVIPHAVDTRIFQPMSAEKSPVPSVVFVGTHDGRKRGSLLLEVFSRVIRRAIPDAELMFVGPAGPAMAGVSYYTGVGDDTLATLYRRAWVFASPSTYEGFGLPYLEAMACGTAIVATPNPGSREVLGDDYEGLVDDSAFGPTVLNLLANADRRRALEAVATRRARQFSLTQMVDRYEALLTELQESHARSVASA